MAAAILTLLNEPGRARQISEAGMVLVQQYAWPKVRNRLLAVYEQVLAIKQTSR
jgi:glycosyltransferase involved in cell wall biosynthesis